MVAELLLPIPGFVKRRTEGRIMHTALKEMKLRAETIGGGWQRMWDEGVGGRILRRRAWLEANAGALHRAVASS